VSSQRPLLLLLAGGVALLHGAFFWQMGRRSLTWPSTPGRVVAAGPLYEYEVEGMRYRSSRVRIAEPLTGLLAAVPDLAPGQQVSVAYDPREPEHAVLEPGTPRASLGFVALGLVLAVLGGWKSLDA
jgi:hypothetical protein